MLFNESSIKGATKPIRGRLIPQAHQPQTPLGELLDQHQEDVDIHREAHRVISCTWVLNYPRRLVNRTISWDSRVGQISSQRLPKSPSPATTIAPHQCQIVARKDTQVMGKARSFSWESSRTKSCTANTSPVANKDFTMRKHYKLTSNRIISHSPESCTP